MHRWESLQRIFLFLWWTRVQISHTAFIKLTVILNYISRPTCPKRARKGERVVRMCDACQNHQRRCRVISVRGTLPTPKTRWGTSSIHTNQSDSNNASETPVVDTDNYQEFSSRGSDVSQQWSTLRTITLHTLPLKVGCDDSIIALAGSWKLYRVSPFMIWPHSRYQVKLQPSNRGSQFSTIPGCSPQKVNAKTRPWQFWRSIFHFESEKGTYHVGIPQNVLNGLWLPPSEAMSSANWKWKTMLSLFLRRITEAEVSDAIGLAKSLNEPLLVIGTTVELP